MHIDILSGKQKEALDHLQAFRHDGYLAGGTSLALQLSHRKSYDFDIFLPASLSQQFRFRVKQHFEKFDILVDSSDEFSFISSFDVKISFIFYPYGHLYELLRLQTLPMADWRDVALDKAHTIGRRGEWRDYVDLYFIVKNGFSIGDIAKDARKKFDDMFSVKLFLSQLCYLGDIQDTTIDFLHERVTKADVQQFFEKGIIEAKDEFGL